MQLSSYFQQCLDMKRAYGLVWTICFRAENEEEEKILTKTFSAWTAKYISKWLKCKKKFIVEWQTHKQ